MKHFPLLVSWDLVAVISSIAHLFHETLAMVFHVFILQIFSDIQNSVFWREEKAREWHALYWVSGLPVAVTECPVTLSLFFVTYGKFILYLSYKTIL